MSVIHRLLLTRRVLRLLPLLAVVLVARPATAQPACTPPYAPATEAALNAAVACVNAAGPGSHAITLAAAIVLTGPVTPFDNPAAAELLLDGNGRTLDGNGHGPILRVASGSRVRVREVVLLRGAAADGAAIRNEGALTVEASRLSGGAATRGGGIFTLAGAAAASLTVIDSTLSDNAATAGGGVAVVATGGQTASVSLRNVTLSGNRATDGPGGIDLTAGAGGRVEGNLAELRLTGNRGGRGGGLRARAEGGTLAVDVLRSTLDGNEATGGGGLALWAANGGVAEVRLLRSTATGNRAANGGGVHVEAAGGGSASLTIFNATLSGNAAAEAGGGALVRTAGGAAGATLVYATLAGNAAGGGGAGLHVAGAGGPASATLAATLLANRPGPDCARPGGSIISTGFNLAGDDTCALLQASDRPAAYAGLLPLAPNPPGGPPTHALGTGSAAIDRIPIGAAGCGTVIAIDQRGAARPLPVGGRCDIGAYERDPARPDEVVAWLPAVRR